MSNAARRWLAGCVLAGLFVVSGHGAFAGGTPCDRLRLRVGNLQNQIYDVERQLQGLDAALFTGRQQTPEEIQRDKTRQGELERQREDLKRQIARVQGQIQSIDRLTTRFNNEQPAFKRDLDAFIAARNQHRTEVEAHNRDAEAQNRAVQAFNALPPQQQSQAECNRLNRWGADVTARANRLNGTKSQLESRQQELIRRERVVLDLGNELNQLRNAG